MYADRISRLREVLASRQAEVALLTSLPNVRYFCGFTGSNGALIITPRRVVLLTDPRYTLQAGTETAAAGAEVVIARASLEEAAAKALARTRDIAFENGRISYASFEALRVRLPKAGSWIGLDRACEELRMVKSPEEIAAIRESVRINSLAYEEALAAFVRGMTETDLAAELEFRMRRHGAEKPSFDTIVAFGKHSALPHAHPGATRVEGSGLLLVDMGSTRGGYASDMTRMAHLGRPGPRARNLYRAVREAQLAALDRVRAGVTAASVDAAARKILAAHGLDKAFVHSTGHGLGLEIHELPRVGRKDKSRLAAGMTITIEPGAYLEELGGVRIEDTIVVTAQGCEVLTPTSKELMVL